jgi:hypothetical protein
MTKKQELDELLDEVVMDFSPPSDLSDILIVDDFSIPPPPPPHAAEKTEKRGRKPKPRDEHGNIIGGKEKPRPILAGVGQTVPHDGAAIDPAAEVAVMMVNASGMMLGGADAAMRHEEVILAKQGFVSYFKAKGVDSIPPWVVLAGALCPYYLRVITATPAKPKITSIFSKLGAYLKGFFAGRKGSKSAYFNSRADYERQNNASTEDSK